MPKISIIIPCYYNEGNIPVTYSKELIENEKTFPADVSFEYVMVDDGSKDNTYQELLKFHAQYPSKVKVIKLSRNFGADNASSAGFNNATGDCCVLLCADLQDPPELILKMYEYWVKGVKLVIANKQNREDNLITKLISNTYHTLIRKFVLPNSPKGGFDLWLFDKQLREEYLKINEKNTYNPYLFMWLGYDYVNIPYTRRKRQIGKSKWTLAKKVKSFVDSFVSFTYFPIRAISVGGMVLGIIALLYGMSVVLGKITGNIQVQGWTSLMIVVLFVSSFQMISLGIIGEYVWRTLDATRRRPKYIIDEIIDQTQQPK